MYEQFGAVVNHGKKTVQFRLFVPDNRLDPGQYFSEYDIRDNEGHLVGTNHAGLPNIDSIKITGDFQQAQPDGGSNWDVPSAPQMKPAVKFPNDSATPQGWLYESVEIPLPEGYYQYRYAVKYEHGEERPICDPCTRYHHCDEDGDRSGFVIGGNAPIDVPALENRLPLRDLIIYELHLEDFTWEFRGNEAPLKAMQQKVAYLQSLGVNAVEILPWTGAPGGGYSWGYQPFLYFAVTNRYTEDRKEPLEKISQLKRLIQVLHEAGIHVIMDGVFNHVADSFPYRQLYQNQDESPFIGNFIQWGVFGADLDYYNGCTNEFILDVCKYWLDVFKIDGIRFDYVKGFSNKYDRLHGLPWLIQDLRAFIDEKPERKNISLILELIDGYQCIDDTNTVNADGCWLDGAYWQYRDSLERQHIDREIMRALNSNKDFGAGRVPVTYLENHDHSSMINRIEKGYFNRGAWWRTQPYLIALMTTPGAVLLHNGQEWGEDAWMPENPWEEKASGISRVIHRAIHWSQADDEIGRKLGDVYRKLITIRRQHPALRSPNFYPADDYNTQFNNQGYGFHEGKQLVIFHRWDGSERFIIVINFSQDDQIVDVPFTANGAWTDLLNDTPDVWVGDHWLHHWTVKSNWGNIFWQKA